MTTVTTTLRISGRKFYTTGSIFAEWTDTGAHRLSDGADVAALVALDQPGVQILDDWDGFGQRLTGTGTIVFDGALVDPGDVLPVPDRFGYQTALYQLVLLAVADAVESASRAAVALRDDPADAARRETARLANGLAEIRAAQAQSFATAEVQLTSRLFDALGASATSRGAGLDRHWRNARTVSSHNPVLFKNRWIGAWELNDELPQPLWAVGTPAAASAAT